MPTTPETYAIKTDRGTVRVTAFQAPGATAAQIAMRIEDVPSERIFEIRQKLFEFLVGQFPATKENK